MPLLKLYCKKGKLMNLDEFKQHIENQRWASRQEAIAKIVSVTDYISVNDLFDQDDLLGE